MTDRRSFEWQVVGWALFFLAFVGAGAVTFDRLAKQQHVMDQSPHNSSDACYWRELKLPDGSRRVEESLALLPKGGRVVLLYRPGTYQSLPAQLISLAAWRRGLQVAEVPAEASDARQQVAMHEPDGVFTLDGQSPEWFSSPRQLGENCAFSLFERK